MTPEELESQVEQDRDEIVRLRDTVIASLQEDFKTLLQYSAPGELAYNQIKHHAIGGVPSDDPAVVERCRKFIEKYGQGS